MMFGLFKKETHADIIFTGGDIRTMDPDAPHAEAVACKNGLILAVGGADWIESFKSKNTQVIDLKGRTLLPGFIDPCGHPVLRAFSEVCLILRDDMSLEEVSSALADYIEERPQQRSYFAYGFRSQLILSGEKEKATDILDKICQDKPLVLLDSNGARVLLNSIAISQIDEAAQEDTSDEEDAKPPVITLPYLLNVLDPIDFAKLQEAVIDIALKYCEMGYTAVFDCGSPDYLHSVYQEILVEMLQEDFLKQRFIGSLLIANEIECDHAIRKLMQKKTSCMEIDSHIMFDTLKLVAKRLPGGEMNISADTLKALSSQASERGFNVHIDAICKEAAICAFEAASSARASGYRNNLFTIAHSSELSNEERTELISDGEVYETSPTIGDYSKFMGMEGAENPADAIDKVTAEAAAQLGISDLYGTVQANKKADFVIFPKDPLGCGLPEFRAMPAAMTVIDGKIVYDAENDDRATWLEIIESRADEPYEDEQIFDD